MTSQFPLRTRLHPGPRNRSVAAKVASTVSALTRIPPSDLPPNFRLVPENRPEPEHSLRFPSRRSEDHHSVVNSVARTDCHHAELTTLADGIRTCRRPWRSTLRQFSSRLDASLPRSRCSLNTTIRKASSGNRKLFRFREFRFPLIRKNVQRRIGHGVVLINRH
jgi:hypothetical protein